MDRHAFSILLRRSWWLALGSLLAPGLPAAAPPALAPPQLDPGKIVNRSLGFLREREPEMSEVEYALYERMLPIVEAAPETALTLLETMLADDEPESAAFEFVLGNVYFALRRLDGAETHYRRAVEQHPTFQRAWVNLGAVYYAGQRYREAVPCFARAVSLGDREAATFGLLGSSLRQAGNAFAAESAYKQAMTADPENPDWMSGLLEIYLETEQLTAAGALARELVQTRPDEPRHWTLYAGLLVRLERPLAAIAALQTAGELELLTPALWQMLGDLCADADLAREAADAYARAGAADGDAVLRYGRTLLALRRFDAAAEVVARLFTADTTPSAPALLLRAELARARGDAEAARGDYDAALRLDPLNGDGLLGLAALHRDAEQWSDAEFLYEQAAHVPAARFAAEVELAQLALRRTDYAAAVQHVQTALAERVSPELQEFKTRLLALIAHETGTEPAP